MPVSPLVSNKTIKLDSKPIDAKQQSVKPPRRVLPEHEGKYKITLPAGTTERSKQILAKKANRKGHINTISLVGPLTSNHRILSVDGNGEKKGIFDRLEKEPKVHVTGVGKPISSSIFARLGGKSIKEDIFDEPSPAFSGVLRKSNQKVSSVFIHFQWSSLTNLSLAAGRHKKSSKTTECYYDSKDPSQSRHNGCRRI